uniref:OTU domain-containing protein n=1 Tax=Anopheles dirus TaxID=7168 RepID=A0A182N662_9DIPT
MDDDDGQDPWGSRNFGEGCRDMPDLHDKFLERIGLYRKHTAPDASCLFRAVAEQRYDVQLHYDRVRRECVAYMRANRTRFEKDIHWDFELYMDNMLLPKSYGTLLELKALALCHGANVMLYKPYSDGYWVVNEPSHERMWRMFVDRDNHFDTVYTMDYMRTAAYCQAIVYQVLYNNVLCLPDVEYAVEVMLHDEDATLEELEDGGTVAHTGDGRRLPLSRNGADTSCALSYPQLCHFHNPDGFEPIQRFFELYGTVEGCRKYIGEDFPHRTRMQNPLLPDANVSCVRQLLSMGIAPIPYTAAKALDPHIYRNVEFDLWLTMHYEERETRRSMCQSRAKYLKPFRYANAVMLRNQYYTGRSRDSPFVVEEELQQPVVAEETVCMDPPPPQGHDQQFTSHAMSLRPYGERLPPVYRIIVNQAAIVSSPSPAPPDLPALPVFPAPPEAVPMAHLPPGINTLVRFSGSPFVVEDEMVSVVPVCEHQLTTPAISMRPPGEPMYHAVFVDPDGNVSSIFSALPVPPEGVPVPGGGYIFAQLPPTNNISNYLPSAHNTMHLMMVPGGQLINDQCVPNGLPPQQQPEPPFPTTFQPDHIALMTRSMQQLQWQQLHHPQNYLGLSPRSSPLPNPQHEHVTLNPYAPPFCGRPQFLLPGFGDPGYMLNGGEFRPPLMQAYNGSDSSTGPPQQ